MVSLGGVGSVASKVMLSWGFWLLMGVVILGVSIGALLMRRRAKFHFPTIILTNNGNGKVGVRFTRAGWFKSKKILGKLVEVGGERRLETKDGRIVQKGSSADFHEINFKTSLILWEKDDDPKILLPVDKVQLTPDATKVLASIAPADYRDACSNIIEDSKKEAQSKWSEIAQILVFGFVGVVLFISIILVIQYVKNTMADAQALHREALQFYEQSLSRLSAVPSGSSAP